MNPHPIRGVLHRMVQSSAPNEVIETVYVPACATRTVVLPTPDGPWRAEVEIETFVPAEVDPERSGGERRALGARVAFGVVPR